MKTTVEIADPLFRRAKQHCSANGISMRELIEASLRLTLAPPKKAIPFRLKSFGFQGSGQAIQDWSKIRELAYDGRGGFDGNDADR
ncbi:MAG: hypothetical protein NTW74_15920 [Acidobacteria bacterium]|nr:hypothetical protein [Acidobacteriota bacterium]